MAKQRRTLKQIAIDMRAAGEMLIEGANEIEQAGTLLESINIQALVGLLGGGSTESLPFLPPAEAPPPPPNPSPSASTPDDSTPRSQPQRRKPGPKPEADKVELTKAQKSAIRERWSRLPPAAQTDQMVALLAQEYGVTPRRFKIVATMDLEAARSRMLAARARIGHSTASTPTPPTPGRPN